MREDQIGNAVSPVQDLILAWTSLLVVLAVGIGAIVYYNAGMDRAAQAKGPYTMTGPQAPGES